MRKGKTQTIMAKHIGQQVIKDTTMKRVDHIAINR